MRINHNIAALNASNSLKSNNNAITKNLQKLSSGYRINSAADDAAGLAVSEKMRAQINGLNQAEDNAQNGISLVQTAEGGLNETESILQRMNTLAVESANGTYQDTTDRANLQKEVTALKKEVDRISTSTNFNGRSLLDGSLNGTTNSTPDIVVSSTVGAGVVTSNAATKGDYEQSVTAFSKDATNTDTSKITIRYTGEDGQEHTAFAQLTSVTAGTTTAQATATGTNSGDSITTPYNEATGSHSTTDGYDANDMATAFATELAKDTTLSSAFDISTSGDKVVLKSKNSGASGAKVLDYQQIHNDHNGANATVAVTSAMTTKTDGKDAASGLDVSKLNIFTGANEDASVFTVGGQKFAFADTAAHALQLSQDVNYVVTSDFSGANGTTAADNMSKLIQQKTGLTSTPSSTTITFTSSASDNANLSFQIGSENKADQRVSLNIGDMSTKGLKIQNVSVATQPDAQAAIDTIKAAVNSVSATRADLGALQNRLEHTTNNLSTMSQNLTSAESTIRDVDMSSEMVDLTKNQILEQAATSMLAQANSLPQSVLSLLKG
jgi:flagellin